MACVGGLNGVGKACDGRACWLPWPPSWFEFDADGWFPFALPSEVSSSAGVVVGGGSLYYMKLNVMKRNWVSFFLKIFFSHNRIIIFSTYHPGTVEASSHFNDVGLTAKPAGQRCKRG